MAHRASQILSPKQHVRVWVYGSRPGTADVNSPPNPFICVPRASSGAPIGPSVNPCHTGSQRAMGHREVTNRRRYASRCRCVTLTSLCFFSPGLLCHPQSQTRDLASLTKTLACGQQPCSPLYSHLVRAAATTRTRSARCFVGTLI